MGRFLLLSWVHQQEVGWEVEQPSNELASINDAFVLGRSWTHCATMSAAICYFYQLCIITNFIDSTEFRRI